MNVDIMWLLCGYYVDITLIDEWGYYVVIMSILIIQMNVDITWILCS